MVQAARSGKQNIAEGYLQKSIERLYGRPRKRRQFYDLFNQSNKSAFRFKASLVAR